MKVVIIEPFGSFEPGTVVVMGREAAMALIATRKARLWTSDEDGSQQERHPDKAMKPRRARRKA